MKNSNKNVLIVGAFFIATFIFLIYLFSIRQRTYLPVAFFWGAVASMLSIITYQCLKIELSPSYAKVVVLEIAITCFAFHLIYQIPYEGLRGLDVYIEMASAKGILSSGFVMGDPQYISGVSYFPVIHIFGATLSLITGLDILSVAKWFPSLIDVAMIPLLYLLVKGIFKEEKVALLSALLFACLQHHILFSSLFIRETYALVLAICCVYLYFSAKHSPHPATKYALSILCLVGTIIAHHLTSFMLLIFLSTHFLVTKAFKVSFLQRTYSNINVKGQAVSMSFLLSAFVVLFAYWTYLATSPFYTLITFLQSVFNPSLWGIRTYAGLAGISAAQITTIRGYIIFYGFYFFHLTFGLILLYGLLPRAKNQRLETYSSTLFLFICGLIGVSSLYLVAAAAFPDRFLMFGWLFGFTPLVVTILKGNYKRLQRVSVLLLVAFMLFNLYMIEPTAWYAGAEEVPLATSNKYYSLAKTFDFSGGKIFGFQNPVMAIYDVHNNLGTIFTLSEINLTKFDWIIIENKNLELEKRYYPEPRTRTIAELELLATGQLTNYTRIYDSNSIFVFKPRQ